MIDYTSTPPGGASAQRRLIFLPGAGADPDFWRPLGERLPAAWAKTYLGWPGLGWQPPAPDVNSIEDLVRLVEDELGDGPADLLAQSMGGLVAIMTALRRPHAIRRIVLSVTSAGVDMPGLGASDWRETYLREHPRAATWITEPRPDLSAVLPTVVQPTLLLWAADDAISPPAVGHRLAELLPDAALHVTPGAGHDLVQTHAAELAPRVEAHLV